MEMEKETAQFPKPALNTTLVPQIQLVRAASQNNITNVKDKVEPGLTSEPSPLDARKIKELLKASGQGYMKETVNSKIKQRTATGENTQDLDESKVFEENPTYVTVP